MNKSQHLDIYPINPSRLSFYPGCNTPISGMLWDRHIKTLRALEAQTTALGMWEVAYEFSLLIAEHIAEQLKMELKAID
jgi:hypothetical protein